LQPLIDDGTITQAQADKIIAALEAAGPMGRGFGDGPMGRHGGKGIVGLGLDVVASTLGISEDEVRSAVMNGQSLADLAVSKGKTAQDLIDALVKEATTRINAAVTAGHLTQDQADKMLSELTARIPDLVNNKLPVPGPWMGGHHRGFGGHPDDDGDGDDAPASTTPTTVTG
jgi:hypothetical protein